MVRRLATVVAAAILVVGPVGGVVRATAGPPTATVSMKSFAFNPASIHIAQGGTVTWTYDEKPTDAGCESPAFHLAGALQCPGHSTTAVTNGANGKPLWDSGVHRADGFPYSHVFTTPGTYHYICVVHGGATPNNPVTHMDGDVIVDPAGNTAPAAAGASAARGAVTVQGEVLARTGGLPWTRSGLAITIVALAAAALRRRVRTYGRGF